jgi:hypothetical protein
MALRGDSSAAAEATRVTRRTVDSKPISLGLCRQTRASAYHPTTAGGWTTLLLCVLEHVMLAWLG